MQVEFTTTVLRGLPVTVTATFEGEELVEVLFYSKRNGRKARRMVWLERKVENTVDAERISEQAYEHFWDDR